MSHQLVPFDRTPDAFARAVAEVIRCANTPAAPRCAWHPDKVLVCAYGGPHPDQYFVAWWIAVWLAVPDEVRQRAYLLFG